MQSLKKKTNAGFTLVELLIVVIILGILAAVVIPQFNSAAAESRESAVASNLATIRQAVELYKLQHNDTYPTANIALELTNRTDKDGTVNAAGQFGPYLRNGFPRSPLDGSDVVATVGAMPAAPSAAGGWIYATDDGEFRINTDGAGPSGTDYFDL